MWSWYESSNRINRDGGGVIIYVRNDLTYQTLILTSDEMWQVIKSNKWQNYKEKKGKSDKWHKMTSDEKLLVMQSYKWQKVKREKNCMWQKVTCEKSDKRLKVTTDVKWWVTSDRKWRAKKSEEKLQVTVSYKWWKVTSDKKGHMTKMTSEKSDKWHKMIIDKKWNGIKSDK